MANLTRNLRDVVKKLAYSTSVDQLKKKGVDKVNVLGMDRIAFLIQEAVKNSLKHRLLALDREEVANATQQEFMRLLKSHQTLERETSELKRLKETAEAQVDELRRELADQQRRLEEKLQFAERDAQLRFDGEDREIAERIGTLLEGMAQSSGDGELRGRVLEVVMDIVREQRRDSIKAQEAARDEEVRNLQRRISKLSTSLEETEHKLVQVASLKELDDGISSIYREVQGLDTDETEFEAKSELMTSIFEANMLLQKKKKAN